MTGPTTVPWREHGLDGGRGAVDALHDLELLGDELV
jgi:hypothetical protein